MPPHLRINAADVINEVMDGEAVVINLATGDYYSLRGSAAYVWSAIDHHLPIEQIVASLADTGAPADEVETGVRELVGSLVADGLVVEVADGTGNGGPPGVSPLEPTPAVYERPALEKFTDMQDLILLDPVHEVDERGWPHVPPAS